MATAFHSSEPSGSIIAFEGHPETISTQLRLLPTSSEILVLPGIQCYLAEDTPNHRFRADAFIRKVHDAILARNEAARAFLETSAGIGKRLVFMSGGTPSAQALCIREILQHEMNSDDEKAEVKFNFLVKEGLAGLRSQAKRWEEHEHFKLVALNGEGSGLEARHQTKSALVVSQRSNSEQLDEDPITRAMRAAEALDRQTGYLQPSTELDLTLSSRPRSLPMYGYSDSYGDAAPFYVFGGPGDQGEDCNLSDEDAVEEGITPRASVASQFAVTHFDDTPDQLPLSPSAEVPYSPSCTGETYGPTFLDSSLPALPTSKSDGFDLRSLVDVVFGEASLMDMREPGGKGTILRSRSLDRLYTSADTCQDSDTDIESAKVENLDGSSSTRPRSWDLHMDKGAATNRLSSIDRPRTIMMKAGLVNVDLAPVPSGKRRKPTHATYIDRGTDADLTEDTTEHIASVFPVMEDLVVYFKEEVLDVILDKMIKGFKDGTYPILSQSTDSSETDTVNDRLPKTPRSSSSCDGEVILHARASEDGTVVSSSINGDAYDPFAYNDYSSWSPTKTSSIHTFGVGTPRVRKIEAPPTAEKTPAQSDHDKDHKLHEFAISSKETPVTTQNSLRTVLNAYFPPVMDDDQQFQFSFLPELEGLWKPIFREAEPGSPRTSNHRMDQILAIGSQQGVDREYSSKIIGLLSKLGFKDSGMNRSGRLDFRYLLANAMQAFTAQPLTNQASDNPFGNPYLLATLIIPHLETYLALNSEVRYLLLEYPPQHLSTVLALQKLVGVELMKVAQIVDAQSGDLGAFKHIRGTSITRTAETSGHLGKPSCSDVSVSKANFLLTSDASESEITTFVTTIRKVLTSVSQYYVPDESVAPVAPVRDRVAQKSKPPPLTSRFSTFPAVQSPATPYGAAGSMASTTQSRPSSVAETSRTFKSARTARSRKSRRRPVTADGAESIMTYDPAEDSDYDFEERRLMPIFLQKPSRRPKPNSRKALKFLGLA